MDLWFMLAGVSFAALAVAQAPSGPARSGPVGVTFPIPGAPFSAQQIEERTHTLSDGTSTTELVTSQIYRDHAGRMRIESSAQSHPLVTLIDPVTRSISMLIVERKIVGQMFGPESPSGGFAVGFPGIGPMLPAGKWDAKTESLGKRTIEDIEVDGTRITRTSQDHPSAIAVEERWVSNELHLMVLATSSGPDWKNTVKLQNISRQDPDPVLFVIPPDYTIQDVR